MKKVLKRKLVDLNVLLAFVLSVSMLILLIACSSKEDYVYNGSEDEYSKTNIQDKDIDEADIVKVNGAGYIFKAQTDGVTVSQIDRNGKIELLKSSKASEEFTPEEMFVYEDKYIIVIGANAKSIYNRNGYYYASSYNSIIVRIYDLSISTEKELILMREDEFQGTYKTSRLYIDSDRSGELYLITRYKNNKKNSNYYIDFYNGEREYDVVDGKGDGFLIAKLNMKKPDSEYKTGLYTGRVYDIYFSKFAIYTMRQLNISRGCSYDFATEIDKISLDNLKKINSIKDLGGFSPNRFCLYDDGTYLYIVNQKANETKNNDETLKRGTYVYTYSSDELRQLASVGALGTDEQLKSARFEKDICYVVTFRVVDPLFKIDLSDPLKPQLKGELKIDGFSSYMQTFTEDILIGIGYGDNRNNLKITAFEVSGDYPDEINSIELQNGFAEAQENPRAILCNPDKNIFAFSAFTRQEENDGTWRETQGAYIFGLRNGELQEIAFLSDLPENYTENSLNSRRYISRIHWIGDYLITISDGFITSYNLNEVMAGNPSIIDKLDTRIMNQALKIDFNTQDDNFIIPSQNIEQGENAIEPPSIVKEGYHVKYWYKDNQTIKYNFNNPVRESFTLYAKWEATITYKILFDTGFLDVLGPLEKYIVIQNKIVSPKNPSKEGYKFLYWYKDNQDEEYDFSLPVEESFILYAKWEKLND